MYTTVQCYIPEDVITGRLNLMHRNRLSVADYYKQVKPILTAFDVNQVPDELLGEQLIYLTQVINKIDAILSSGKLTNRFYRFYYSVLITIMSHYLSLLLRHLPHLYDDTIAEGFYYTRIHGNDWYHPEQYWRKLAYYLRGLDKTQREVFQLCKIWFNRGNDKYVEHFHDYLGLFTQLGQFVQDKIPQRVIASLDTLRYSISGYFVINDGLERVTPIEMVYKIESPFSDTQSINYQRIRLNYIFSKPVVDDRPAFLSDYVMKEKTPLSVKPTSKVKIIVKKSRKLTKEQQNELKKSLGLR